MNARKFFFGLLVLFTGRLWASQADAAAASLWQIGKPVVTYWAGPAMTDTTAQQMAEGGWNLVWSTEKELDTAHRHGLRAQLYDPLLAPANLDEPGQRQKLDALIERVRGHPAMYAYFITDEPNQTNFAGLGKLVTYLRERDPAHLAYINLFPTYANNGQLGTQGDTITAYQSYLDQFVDTVKPALLSYDHYQFAVKGDNADYFLNLALVKQKAEQARVPFLNIVQACTWAKSMRVPTPNEMRYLVYTTAAYGAEGISYYVYSCPGHTGMIAHADGTPTVRYDALKSLNREFVAIASQLQSWRSLGVYHAGMLPPGALALAEDAPVRLEPPLPLAEYRPPKPVKGVLLGFFAPNQGQRGGPTQAVIVNLDYEAEITLGLSADARFQLFDATAGTWSRPGQKHIQLRLPPGGGKLLRVKG